MRSRFRLSSLNSGLMKTLRAVAFRTAFGACLSIGAPMASVQAEPAAIHVIVIEGVKFNPGSLTVKKGDWVRWVNKDPFPHTATAAGVFDSHSIPSGGAWKYHAVKAGIIEYACTLHPNMKATLQVE